MLLMRPLLGSRVKKAMPRLTVVWLPGSTSRLQGGVSGGSSQTAEEQQGRSKSNDKQVS